MLPGVVPFFQTLREVQLPFVLVTNNSTQSVENVRAHLAETGVEIDPGEVLTSATGVAQFLGRKYPEGADLYVVGAEALHEALSERGLRVLLQSSQGVQAVVVGMDPSLTWEKLSEATYAIRAGALFLGTNPDRTFPTMRGLGPGAGSILSALQAATDVEPLIFGKPEPYLFEEALRRLKCEPSSATAIGDRLETDILGGQKAGLKTILLLSGVTTRAQLDQSPIRPDYIYADLPELTEALRVASS